MLSPVKNSSKTNAGLSLSFALSIALTASGFNAPCLAAEPEAKHTVPLTTIKTDSGAEFKLESRSQSSGETEGDKEHDAAMRAEAMAQQARQNEAVQHYDQARNYLSAGNTEMADIELQAAIWQDANTKIYHREYCLVALMRGHALRALAEAIMVVGLGEPVALSDAQVGKLRDTACKLHYRRGIELSNKHKWPEAIAEYLWALQYRPKNARVMRSMAFANASQGKIELAEQQYGTSFADDPADAYGHADLAFLLADSGKANLALEQLQAAVKLQPKVAALHIDLGWLAESKGDLGEAEGEFATAAKLSPDHAALWTHLGKLLVKQGKPEEAAQAYNKALALDPQASEAQSGIESLKEAHSQVHEQSLKEGNKQSSKTKKEG